MKKYSLSEAEKENSIISEEDFNTEYLESINNPDLYYLNNFQNCHSLYYQ